MKFKKFKKGDYFRFSVTGDDRYCFIGKVIDLNSDLIDFKVVVGDGELYIVGDIDFFQVGSVVYNKAYIVSKDDIMVESL